MTMNCMRTSRRKSRRCYGVKSSTPRVTLPGEVIRMLSFELFVIDLCLLIVRCL